MRRLILFFLVLLVCVSVVYGECPPDCGPTEPVTYDTFETYEVGSDDYYMFTSDWGDEIDFSNQLIWENPNVGELLSNPDTYASASFYENFHNFPKSESADDTFGVDIYKDIQWDKFDFSNENIDLTKLDWDQAASLDGFQGALRENSNGALDKYEATYIPSDQTLNLGSTDVISFGDGSISTSLGGEVTFSEHSNAIGFIVSNDGKITVILDEPTDALTTSKISPDTSVTYHFSDGGIVDGKAIYGRYNKLEFRDGEYYLPAGKDIVINGLEVSNGGEGELAVYGLSTEGDVSNALQDFEQKGEYHKIGPELYSMVEDSGGVYVGDESFAIAQSCSDCDTVELMNPSFEVQVLPDNNYGLDVEEGDFLTMSPLDGSISASDFTLDVQGSVKVNNGVQEVVVDNGNVYSKAAVYDLGSVPGSIEMDVFVTDIDGNNPYEDYNNDHYVDNYFTFTGNQDINMGDPPVSHFSVLIDPYGLLSNEDTPSVVDNLFLSGAKKPFVIVETPESGEGFQNVVDDTTDIYLQNMEPDELPLVIEMEGNDNFQEQANEDFFRNIVVDVGLDEDISLKVIGHSSYREIVQVRLSDGSWENLKSTMYGDSEQDIQGQLSRINEDNVDFRTVADLPVSTSDQSGDPSLAAGGRYSVRMPEGHPWGDSVLGCSRAGEKFYEERDLVLLDAANRGDLSIVNSPLNMPDNSIYVEQDSGVIIYNLDRETGFNLENELNNKFDNNIDQEYSQFVVSFEDHTIEPSDDNNYPTGVIAYDPNNPSDGFYGGLQTTAIVDVVRDKYPEETEGWDTETILVFASGLNDMGKLNYDCDSFSDTPQVSEILC